MKVIVKDQIEQYCKYEQIIAEKRIMQKVDSQFIVQLHYAFQNVV